MEAQLHLLPTEPAAVEADWRLDEHTRDLGRRGIQEARAALRTALQHRHDDDDEGHASAA
jgi:hypothetical protein